MAVCQVGRYQALLRMDVWAREDARRKARRTRGAGVSIKSRTPAEMLGWGPVNIIDQAREAGDRRIVPIDVL